MELYFTDHDSSMFMGRSLRKYIVWFAVVAVSCVWQVRAEKRTGKIGKPALMWFDAEANFARFSQKDSIDFYLRKIKSLGFTHAVVDVRPITGEVLFDSKYAPRMEEWNGARRGDFDYLGYFLERGHELGLEIHASLNIFSAGHNYFDRGMIYDGHPDWASIVYHPDLGLIPITQEKHKYAAMVNPLNEEYRMHILDLLRELVGKYPALDGLMLDRVRYDGISADFSVLSRRKFEEYVGCQVKCFPEDILTWKRETGKPPVPVLGKLAKKWFEWRAKTITDFMTLMRKEVKKINPGISFGTYTGSWYPSYYEVGVNFASCKYDPALEFDWATQEYKNYGYAELLDLYVTGNYYTDITIRDYEKNSHAVWNENDSRAHQGIWYCVEGACQNLRRILKKNRFMGGILVDQFYACPEKLIGAIAENLKNADGLMVFDIVHIITKNLWKEVEEGMRKGGNLCRFPSMDAKSKGQVVKGNDSAVKYVGRTRCSEDGSVTFDWVGTYLKTRLSGGKLSVRLSETGNSFYNVFVDGQLHRVVKTCGIDTVIDFVSGIDGKLHSLCIQKRTEGEFGRTTIHQFLLANSGALLPEPEMPKRHIEFIGNSLTCGYGVEGKDKKEPFRLETENCNLSFSTIIARYFDANYSLIAHSGRGVVRNYGDSVRVSSVTMKDKMLQTFDEGTDPWEFKAYRPDLVVINLGTNDFSLEPQPYKSEFVKAYTSMLRQLRLEYGKIPILCVYCCTVPAPVYGFYEEAVAEMSDKDIYLLKLEEKLFNENSDYGAVCHPNYSGQRKMAMSIIPFVSSIMGWELLDKVVE